jgi:23S rRNA pseudouridine2605 synthase
MTDENRPEANEEKLIDAVEVEEIEDPIGDVTDGEAKASQGAESEAEIEAAEDDAFTAAEDEPEIKAEDAEEDEAEPESRPRPPAKLERLQKILAAAGVASRRKAEEMIEQGRVQLNGKVVTALGTKADAGRDHIRVDGKLLHGAERLRYFVLNKPRGFVTTVKDPEGRPTVMQFFDKLRERLYPVGRLDYMSEGLLLVTNDGELANKLTRASAGVEKTYLVKVAGIPSESELDILRAGVAIEKGKPGSDKVRTSPARIRQVRQGDNPWYEVVLIEGRNRELRKMFEEVGHFVEKIRRVGYGPLILDQEPGHLRELDPQELELLRKAADGKLRTPKAKEIRRRNVMDSLPPEKPAFRARGAKPAVGPKDYRPKKSFGVDKSFGSARPVRSGPGKSGSGPVRTVAERSADGPAMRPSWKKDDRPAAGRTFGAKPGGGRPFGSKSAAGRSFPTKPAWKKPEGRERSSFRQPPGPRLEAPRHPFSAPKEDHGPKTPSRLRIEPVQDFGRSERTGPSRPASGRPPSGYANQSLAGSDRPGAGRAESGRPGSARPFRGAGGLARPFTTSSGKPRAGGARPSSKPGSAGGRTYGSGGGSGRGSASAPNRPARPFAARGEGAGGFRPRGEDSRTERRTGTGWKPKPNFAGKDGSGKSRPASGEHSKPKAGGFSKSGFKGKSGSSGAKRTGPKPGGKKPGGRRP